MATEKCNELTPAAKIDVVLAGLAFGTGIALGGWGWFAAAGVLLADAFYSLWKHGRL